jgi:Flp pilus assembly protein TadD
MTRTEDRVTVSPERVEMLCDLGRWEEAVPLVHRLLTVEPENESAWCLLAQCRIGLGQFEAALAAARQAAVLAPGDEWPQRLISFACTHLGLPEEALRAAREAVRLDPHSWQTYARLAAAAVRPPTGRPRDRAERAGRAGSAGAIRGEAMQAAERALTLAPDEPQVQLIYGTVAASGGRRVEAERAYRTALALDPQNSGAHHLLAALRLRRRSGPVGLAEAATGFATALSADPTAHLSRRSLELTLRVFLGRATYGLFVTAYLSQLFAVGSTPWSRLTPILLLALPLLFVVGFLRRLPPQVRSFLGRMLLRGTTGLATGLGGLSVAVMVVDVVAARSARPGLAALAAVIALLARGVLYLDTRRLVRPKVKAVPR